jgi:hypothetical protein
MLSIAGETHPTCSSSSMSPTSEPTNKDTIATPATSEHGMDESLSSDAKEGKVYLVKQESSCVNFTHSHFSLCGLLICFQSLTTHLLQKARRNHGVKMDLQCNSKKRSVFAFCKITKQYFLLIAYMTLLNHEQ